MWRWRGLPSLQTSISLVSCRSMRSSWSWKGVDRFPSYLTHCLSILTHVHLHPLQRPVQLQDIIPLLLLLLLPVVLDTCKWCCLGCLPLLPQWKRSLLPPVHLPISLHHPRHLVLSHQPDLLRQLPLHRQQWLRHESSFHHGNSITINSFITITLINDETTHTIYNSWTNTANQTFQLKISHTKSAYIFTYHKSLSRYILISLNIFLKCTKYVVSSSSRYFPPGEISLDVSLYRCDVHGVCCCGFYDMHVMLNVLWWWETILVRVSLETHAVILECFVIEWIKVDIREKGETWNRTCHFHQDCMRFAFFSFPLPLHHSQSSSEERKWKDHEISCLNSVNVEAHTTFHTKEMMMWCHLRCEIRCRERRDS